MRNLPNRKKSKELLEELRQRFLDGEKMSVEDIVSDYFDPKNPFNYLQAKEVTRSWMSLLKQQFRQRHGLWFGNLDDQGNYGFVTTEAEVRYAMTKYYNFMKGVATNASFLAQEARTKGLLPEGVRHERITVSRLRLEEGDEEVTATAN